MQLLFRLSCLSIALVLGPSATSAQAPEPSAERVVLLAPEATRAEWSAALQLELAGRGTVVVPADAPEAATALLGDAEAQRLALAHGARASVWVESRASDLRLRIVGPRDERALVVPLAANADPRTVALIVVSLLDEGLPIPAVAPVVMVAAPEAPPAATLDVPSVAPQAPEASEPPAPSGPRVRWSGRLGVAGMVMVDGVTDGGSILGVNPAGTIRAGIAMRYEGFEASILHDLGLYEEVSGFVGVQPLMRGCLELGGATRPERIGFHAGARGCVGSRVVAETQFFPTGELFTSNGPRPHLSGGGYFAVAFPFEGWLRIFLRMDVDAGWTQLELGGDRVDVTSALSLMFGFE